MTEDQYDLLEELYFISSYASLQKSLSWEQDRLQATLAQLLDAGWVRPAALHDGQTPASIQEALAQPSACHYLATREGLKAHRMPQS